MAKINRRNVTNNAAVNAAENVKEEVAMKKEATVTENAPETKEQQTPAPEKDAEEKAPETPTEENQENLPAAVPEKKPLLRFKSKEEKAAEKAAKQAERLAKSNALRAEGHVVKAALSDLGGAIADGAVMALKVGGVLAAGTAIVAGGLAMAKSKAEKEESGEDPDEPEIIGTDTYEEHKEEETTETDKVEVVEF